MGRPRIKVIETAIDTKKAEELEKKKLEVSKETEEKIEEQAKAAKKTAKVEKKDKKPRLRSKNYEEKSSLVDKTKEYTLSEGIDLIKQTSAAGFDASVEVHVNLNTDPTKSDQLIRRPINLPHSSGKTIRVLVFGGDAKTLKGLGAEVGSDSTIEKIDSGKVSVDKVVATPEWMPKLAKSAKILGPKGLMPNPKSGTVTEKPEELVKNLQGGMIEIKTEKAAIIHTTAGKISFPKEKLEANIKALITEIQKAKPEGLKKSLIKSVYLSSTMGPSVKLDLSSL